MVGTFYFEMYFEVMMRTTHFLKKTGSHRIDQAETRTHRVLFAFPVPGQKVSTSTAGIYTDL